MKSYHSAGVAQPDSGPGPSGLEEADIGELRDPWGDVGGAEDGPDFLAGSESGGDDEATLEEEEVSGSLSPSFLSVACKNLNLFLPHVLLC